MKRVLAILILSVIIPFVSFSQNPKAPSTLEGMVEAVKDMSANNVPKKQIASWMASVIDGRITNLNSGTERMLDNRSNSEMDKIDDKWVIASINDNRVIANYAWDNQMGTCQDLANLVYYILKQAKVPEDYRIVDINNAHQFTVWGLAPDADIGNPDTWGPDAIVPDGWTGKTADSDDVKSGWYYQFYQPNKNQITDRTSDFDINALVDLRAKMDKAKALRNEILEEGRKIFENVNTNLNEVKSSFKVDKDNKDYLKNYKKIASGFVWKGDSICGEADKLQTKIKELSKAIKDDEEIFNDRINQASARVAYEDNIFVKTSYQEAKDVVEKSKKEREEAFNYFVELNICFKHIERVNLELETLYSLIKNKLKPEEVKDHKWRENQNNLLKPIPEQLDQLKKGIEDAKNFQKRNRRLKKIIENSKKFYIQSLPEYKAQFNQLFSEIESLKNIDYVVDLASLSDLRQLYHKLEQAVLFSPTERKKKKSIKIKKYDINCFSIESSQKEMEKIKAIYSREFHELKDNEFLSDGCVPTSEPMQEVAAEIPDTPDNGIDPPNIPTDTTATNTPDKSIFGGLSIGGPSEIIVGKGAQFIALDGIGDPFPNKGSFEWINTREGLMVLSRSGMTAHSLGFKPGKATIILKYDGMTAYKDINIVKKKKASLSTSNDEEIISTIGGEINKDEEDINSIGTTGGEVSGNNQLQEQCSELIDRITIFLNSFDIDAARDYTNRAVALGCDVNAGAVNALIAQIEDIKKAEQKEWEQQYANQNIQSRSDVERSQKRNQNLNRVMNLLGEQVIAISNSNDRIRQEKKDRNNANFEKSQKKINVYFANTKKPPIIDPNHVSNTYKPPVRDDQYVSIGNPSSGMSFAECDKKFCPICYEGETQIDLFGVQVNRQCNKCRKENKTKIDDCIKGGSAANSTDRNLSEFRNYTAYKCTWTWKDSYKVIHHEIFYDYTGPEHTGKRKGKCTNVSKGTAHECYWKASDLNSQYGTVNHLVLPR